MRLRHYSFIDFGLRDFLRDENGKVIYVKGECFYDAQDWLLANGESHGWANTQTQTMCWEDESWEDESE